MTRAAVEELDEVLRALDARHVAPGEWGLTVECGGWPLSLGLRVTPSRPPWLSVQGEVCGAGRLDPHWLLHRGRRDLGVRYTHTSSGAVWVQLDVPADPGVADRVDELLGRVLEAAEAARSAARYAERRA